ncbi:MtrAB system response regulator MtrA [Cutibacterium sp.]|uniref:MtrAB system response regulator MtrA n=1 Tax=Cutibacterium sp. TaxID=1912221 RepID=UPI0026DB0043|nr:MtrAB system response regulator MtrA [Cutibacterium sp.]MDO4412092.1 MtrAB system response regulator MtrA [Cutibacterium sp.]
MGATDEQGPILVVDDDPALAEMLQLVLAKEGFSTVWVGDGNDVMNIFRQCKPALVLLDLMLPGRDGIHVCHDIRRESGIPIIMLTARSDTTDVVHGLGAGADDYVSKPFRSAELVARIRARLRTPQRDEGGIISVGDLTIDPAAHVVQRGGEEISLTPLEYSLLVTMAQHPNRVFSRETLLRDVWGYTSNADTRLVNVHVQRLRSKVEINADCPRMIVTVRGVGYRISAPGEES